MAGVDALAHALRTIFSLLRAAGIQPAAAMSAADIRSNAHGLSYAILASGWQKRARVPGWPEIYNQWRRRLPNPPAVETEL